MLVRHLVFFQPSSIFVLCPRPHRQIISLRPAPGRLVRHRQGHFVVSWSSSQVSSSLTVFSQLTALSFQFASHQPSLLRLCRHQLAISFLPYQTRLLRFRPAVRSYSGRQTFFASQPAFAPLPQTSDARASQTPHARLPDLRRAGLLPCHLCRRRRQTLPRSDSCARHFFVLTPRLSDPSDHFVVVCSCQACRQLLVVILSAQLQGQPSGLTTLT